MAGRPLGGIRVVELGVWVAGPGAGGVLAEWGADVIKVEPPDGDPMRRLFAITAGHGQPQSPPFDLDNRGKRSVVLDLRDHGDRATMRRLVDTADVFVTNLRPDAVERLGLGPDQLLPDLPRLVYANVTGYGREGPDADRAGYDVGAFWARTGMALATTPEGEGPAGIRAGLGDHVTAMALVAGVCAALHQRNATGVGQLVDTSLLRTGIWSVGWDFGIQLRFGKLAPTLPRTETMNPTMNPYEARDARWFWLLGLESDRHWPGICRAVEHPEWCEQEPFASSRGRRKQANVVISALDRVFAGRDRDDWTRRFDAEGVWWAPVHTFADVVEDPQAHAAGAFVDVPDGGGAAAHRAVATPVTFGGVDSPVGPVPALGAHTAEVLAELELLTARPPYGEGER
jgi:crotonobetainyl-CoA:carnitine CoA-transferase CaiB-like acyl-CoA transferase